MSLSIVASGYVGFSGIVDVCTHSGELYAVGTSGTLVKWNGTDAWEQQTTPFLAAQFPITSIVSYSGSIWGGAGNISGSGTLVQWNVGDPAWSVADRFDYDTSHSVSYLHVHDGTLYSTNASRTWSGDRGYLDQWHLGSGALINLHYAFGGDYRLYSWSGELLLLGYNGLRYWDGSSIQTKTNGDVGNYSTVAAVTPDGTQIYSTSEDGGSAVLNLYTPASGWVSVAGISEADAWGASDITFLSDTRAYLAINNYVSTTSGYLLRWDRNDTSWLGTRLWPGSYRTQTNLTTRVFTFEDRIYCANQTDGNLYRHEPAYPAFTVTPLSGIRAVTPFTFSDTSSGTIDSWSWRSLYAGTHIQWMTPSSQVATGIAPSPYTYPGSTTLGFQTVGLALNSREEFALRESYIEIRTLDVNLSGTPRLGPAPLAVQFYDTSSTGWPTGWYWTFGDGNTSTDQNPTHMYSGFGSFNVVLTAYNGTGNTETKNSYITTYPSGTDLYIDLANDATSGVGTTLSPLNNTQLQAVDYGNLVTGRAIANRFIRGQSSGNYSYSYYPYDNATQTYGPWSLANYGPPSWYVPSYTGNTNYDFELYATTSGRLGYSGIVSDLVITTNNIKVGNENYISGIFYRDCWFDSSKYFDFWCYKANVAYFDGCTFVFRKTSASSPYLNMYVDAPATVTFRDCVFMTSGFTSTLSDIYCDGTEYIFDNCYFGSGFEMWDSNYHSYVLSGAPPEGYFVNITLTGCFFNYDFGTYPPTSLLAVSGTKDSFFYEDFNLPEITDSNITGRWSEYPNGLFGETRLSVGAFYFGDSTPPVPPTPTVTPTGFAPTRYHYVVPRHIRELNLRALAGRSFNETVYLEDQPYAVYMVPVSKKVYNKNGSLCFSYQKLRSTRKRKI